jgi:hypothetical protein
MSGDKSQGRRHVNIDDRDQGRLYGDSSHVLKHRAPAIQAARLCEVTFDAMWQAYARSSPARRWAMSARRFSATRRATAFP